MTFQEFYDLENQIHQVLLIFVLIVFVLFFYLLIFPLVLHLSNLEKLDLVESNIDDPFPQEIAKLPKLKTVWADHTRLTNAGLPYLNDMTQLKSLSTRDTAVTREGMLQLRH